MSETLKKIEGLAIGRPVKGWRCCCGALFQPDGVVVGVRQDMEGVKGYHFALQIKTGKRPGEFYDYSCGLGEALSEQEIKDLGL